MTRSMRTAAGLRGCTALLVVLIPLSMAAAQETPVSVAVDPSLASEWTVDARIFGKFFEPNGRDAYPGLYAQHLSNSSLEEWYHLRDQPWQTRTSILFRDTDEHSGLAYPWEPTGDASYNQLADDPAHGSEYQQVFLINQARGGLFQRTALPHYRTLGYDVTFSARGEFIDSLDVILFSGDRQAGVDTQRVALAASWKRDTLHFDLGAAEGPCYQADGSVCSPSGIYTVQFEATGVGAIASFDLDWVTLIPDDAPLGKYNPTTIDWLQRFNVVSIRWGGNWMSAYEWEHGIGPIEDRPVTNNIAWGGLEHNYLGTAEFLELCELAGVEPLLNVAFNYDGNPPETTPEEAADWVEYVNGSTDTEMGALRAAHGYPEPWNVKLWQVGNETYGGYQSGHTDEVDYAQKIREYSAAMRGVDPSITFIAAGVDPLYRDYGPGNDQRPTWNQTLLDIAGDVIDGIDIHRYVRGTVDDNRRNNMYEPMEYAQVMVAFPTQYEDIMQILRSDAEQRGYPDMKIEVGEWNLQPQVSAGWPRPDYPKMSHAAFTAGMYNAFIRQGDVVRYTYQRDNTLFYRPFPIDFRAINPAQYTMEFYADPFIDEPDNWNHLPLVMDGPTFFMARGSIRQQDTPDVPYVDGAAIISIDRSRAHVFLVNRDLDDSYTVTLSLPNEWIASDGRVPIIRQESTGGPFTAQWAWSLEPPFINNTAFEVTRDTLGWIMNPGMGGGGASLDMEPTSIVRIDLQLAEHTAVEDPALAGRWRLNAPYPSPTSTASSVTIEYETARTTDVQLVLYDALGREVRRLAQAHEPAGVHRREVSTSGLAAGTYFLRMKAESITITRPLTVVP